MQQAVPTPHQRPTAVTPASPWPDPDRDYANAAFIPGGSAYPPRWSAKAATFRAARAAHSQLDLAYGPGERQKLDLFLPDSPPRGMVVFVHGGYWHLFDKSAWSHLAAGPLALGFGVACLCYTLAPAARLAEMTVEIAAGCRFLAAAIPGPMVVTGHSAGGHLAARMGCDDLDLPVRRVLAISPLAELGPLIATTMNQTLAIDAEEAARESPARLKLRPGVSAHVWVGGDERPAFLWQARSLAESWACPWTVEPGRHHFDVVEGLEDATSPLCAALLHGL